MTLRKSFQNYCVGKGANAGNQHFLIFPQYLRPFSKQNSISGTHLICRLQMLSIWTSLNFWHVVQRTPLPNKPWFLRVYSTSLLKTLQEKEKLLITSNFSFYQFFFQKICTAPTYKPGLVWERDARLQ